MGKVSRCITFVWIGFLLLVSGAHAENAGPDSIDYLFEKYMDKYNHYIQTGVLKNELNLYHEQVMLLSSKSSPSVTPSVDFNQGITTFLDKLKSQGVAKVQWESVRVHKLSDSYALVSNIAVRYRENGEVFNRVGATYFVSKLDERWLIAAFAIHEPDTTAAFEPLH